MGLHPADGAAGHPEGGGVGAVEVVHIAAQFLFGGGRPALRAAEQRRVPDEPPPHHDAGKGGKLGFQPVQGLRGGDVTVVADGHLAVGEIPRKGGTVGLAPVELLHHAGMDGQLTDGVLIINGEDRPELLGALDAQPGLDRHRSLHGGEHRVQKGVELGGVPEHPGPLALGGHRAGGAPEVQVDLGAAQLPHLADEPPGQLAVLGEDLRHHRHPGVPGIFQLGHLLFDEDAILRRRQKRCVVSCRCTRRTEPFLVHLPPDAVRQPLHRGGVVVHRETLSAVMRYIESKQNKKD